ncbi:MAG TPA: hypothetical protein VK254_00695 [Candidatus Bathyarchaeia archaeon]|nr:hypothetical protein [Candidatus Bathyarchaeia archaeon]HLP47544.1 hypothetical protein [Candidatus Kapabacteria bacterium]
MSKAAKDKIKELDEVLTGNFDLRGSRQMHVLFPQYYEKKILELETLLSDVYGIHGKAKAIALAAGYLINEIVSSKEFEEKAEADKKENNGKEV